MDGRKSGNAIYAHYGSLGISDACKTVDRTDMVNGIRESASPFSRLEKHVYSLDLIPVSFCDPLFLHFTTTQSL